MHATMELLLLRPNRKLISSSSLILLLLFLSRILSLQSNAYTIQVATRTTQQCSYSQRCALEVLIQQRTRYSNQCIFVLYAEERGSSSSSSNDSPKKKRRRKQPTNALSDTTSTQTQQQSKTFVKEEFDETDDMKDVDLTMMNEIAKYEFQNQLDVSTLTPTPGVVDDDAAINYLEAPLQSSSSTSTVSGAIRLPDIKEARKRKQMEEENARIQQEQDEQKVKIKRTDKEAFRRVRTMCFVFECIP
jgi:hypothetical protein